MVRPGRLHCLAGVTAGRDTPPAPSLVRRRNTRLSCNLQHMPECARDAMKHGTAVAFDSLQQTPATAAGDDAMSRTNVLVVSSGSLIGEWLASRLRRDQFTVRTVRPGAALIEAVRSRQPHLAVLDQIDAHPETAQLAVALLKDRNPGVRIVALSDASSEADGEVVEQGIFCYLASCSREELLRVIEAAARAGRGRSLPQIESEPGSVR